MLRPMLALFLWGLTVLAAPAPGDILPDFSARDVEGAPVKLHDLLGGKPALVVCITDQVAVEAMDRWYGAADVRALPHGRVSIVSIDTPWFVPEGTARGRAAGKVPPRWRRYTLFDTDHRMAKGLGLEGDPQKPWVFAVDAEGRVLARFHGRVADPGAARVFEALER